MAQHFTSTSRNGHRACEDIAIVLIDDDPAFRISLAELLRDDGHELLDFDHPGALPGFENLREVALLVTDYDMPGQNGLQVADAFHARHPDIPVLLLTGCDTSFLAQEVERRPFLHLLIKPVDYTRVHDLIHQLGR